MVTRGHLSPGVGIYSRSDVARLLKMTTSRVYHDSATLFARLSEDAVIELSKHYQQLISAHVFEPYLKEVDFSPLSSLAERWWPLGRDVPVVLDPRIAFGAPVVAGTATR